MVILLLEDSQYLKAFLTEIIKGTGHTVDARENGSTVLEEGFDWKKFGAVVTDLDMPEVNGFEVIEALGRQNCDIGCFLHSSSPLENIIKNRYGDLVAFFQKNPFVALGQKTDNQNLDSFLTPPQRSNIYD